MTSKWLRSAVLGILVAAGFIIGTASISVGAEDFLISYWLGPEPSQEAFAQIAAANFTVAMTGGGRNALDLAQKNGLKVLIEDGRITAKNSGDKDFEKNLDAVVADYAAHPALWGYYVTDEPNASQFKNLGAINQYLLKKDPRHVPVINLFPTYATPQQLGNPTYEEHVASFLRIVRPKLLSYDHYALFPNGLRPDYFENMEIVRRLGLKEKTPFSFVLLSIPHFGYRNPSEADLRWQVNTALAYGARGIVYFTYMTPPPTKEFEGWHDAIVSTDGKPNRKYAEVQRINGEVKRIAPTLMQMVSTAVYHTAPVPKGATAMPANDLVAGIEGGQFVVGHFRSEAGGERYIMFVNRDSQKAADATLALSGAVKFSQIDPPGASDVGTTGSEGGKTIWRVHFDPGQRRLIKLGPKESVWEPAIRKFEDQDRKNPPAPNGVVFVGSSSIVGWDLPKFFPGLQAVNRGFGGSQLADSVQYADRIVTAYRPRVVVLYAGDNDLAGDKSPEAVAADYRAFVAKVQKALPETRIVYVAVKPSPARWHLIEKVRRTNHLIEAATKDDPRLKFVDVVAPMLDKEGKPRPELFQPDKLHLNAEGYRLWSGLVQPLL